MQLAEIDLAFGQALAKELGEHWMPAVPLIALLQVNRKQEEIACLKGGNKLSSIIGLADVRGQFGIEAAQDRDFLHKCEQLAR
ncbi:hypothetical protein D3C87_1630420 [compost metagenome]